MTALLIVIVVVVGVGAPIWIAAKAPPLAYLPCIISYRWATYWAVTSALLAIGVPIGIMPTIRKRGLDEEAIMILLECVLLVLAAAGLFRKMRVGVAFLIASEVYVFFLPALISALHISRQSYDPHTLSLLVLIVVNVFYFKKRWSRMAPGLWPKA